MLTKAQKREYLKSGGNRCPYCGTDDISAEHFDGETTSQKVACQNPECGKEWYDYYRLVDILEIE